MDPQLPVIRLERGMRQDFLEEIYEVPGGENVKECIQCGTCSGSCPASPYMEHTPRQIFAMIRAGMRDDVLASNTIWKCASCYLCAVRCPSKIKITDIMYALKRLAVKEGKAPPKAPLMAEIFVDNINSYGRNSEWLLIAKYYAMASPFKALSLTGMGMSMYFSGRLFNGYFPKLDRIERIEEIQKIIARVNQEGEV